MEEPALTHPIIKRRYAEQREMIDLAAGFVRSIAGRLEVEQAWVVGSVARGDFNVWSDIDVVILARQLPREVLARADLFIEKPARVNVVAYTPEEFDKEVMRRNPLAIEAKKVGIPIGLERNSSSQSPSD